MVYILGHICCRMELVDYPRGPLVAVLLRVAVGKLRVYLRFQFEAIDQAPMWENEESCLMDREHGTSSDRGCEKKLVVIRRDPSLRSGHVAGAFAPATS